MVGSAAQGAARTSGRTPPAVLVRHIFDAFDRGDIDAVVEACHPHAVLWMSREWSPPGTAYHGGEGVRTFLAEILPRRGHVRVTVEEVTEFWDSAVVKLAVRVADVRMGTWMAFRFRDDLAIDAREFPSKQAALDHVRAGHLLTPREREIFELLARGRRGPQIATELFLSPETVRTHVQNGVERLGARTRVQAVAIALARGEISV